MNIFIFVGESSLAYVAVASMFDTSVAASVLLFVLVLQSGCFVLLAQGEICSAEQRNVYNLLNL